MVRSPRFLYGSVKSSSVLVGILLLAACGLFARGEALGPEPRRAPVAQPPRQAAGLPAWNAALKASGPRIVVSLEQRWLWLVEGHDTLLSAPVAVGMHQTFTYNGKTFHFATPRGRRKVVRKEEQPVWVVPEWHYFEKAAARGLTAVPLGTDARAELSDGTHIEVRGDQAGRVNRFGNFWPFTPGKEIIFDGKIFIPPIFSAQRRVPDALGPYKLDTGNGYLIHGTHKYNEGSIGRAVSHGCIRMRNEDLGLLYATVRVGTPVYIY